MSVMLSFVVYLQENHNLHMLYIIVYLQENLEKSICIHHKKITCRMCYVFILGNKLSTIKKILNNIMSF